MTASLRLGLMDINNLKVEGVRLNEGVAGNLKLMDINKLKGANVVLCNRDIVGRTYLTVAQHKIRDMINSSWSAGPTKLETPKCHNRKVLQSACRNGCKGLMTTGEVSVCENEAEGAIIAKFFIQHSMTIVK